MTRKSAPPATAGFVGFACVTARAWRRAAYSLRRAPVRNSCELFCAAGISRLLTPAPARLRRARFASAANYFALPKSPVCCGGGPAPADGPWAPFVSLGIMAACDVTVLSAACVSRSPGPFGLGRRGVLTCFCLIRISASIDRMASSMNLSWPRKSFSFRFMSLIRCRMEPPQSRSAPLPSMQRRPARKTPLPTAGNGPMLSRVSGRYSVPINTVASRKPRRESRPCA
jgi:hypothetical protein